MANDGQKTKEQVVVEAATVVVFRNGGTGAPEILMIQRAKELSFAGSAVVFPGGKIHDSDRDLARSLGTTHGDDTAARIASIREVIEETGLVIGISQRASADQAQTARAMLADREDLAPVLRHFGWTLDLECLVPFARWVPTFKPGRIFDTRFYLANLGSGNVELTPDLGESTRLFWASARDALNLIETGEIKAIYPTRRNLERLAQFASFNDAAKHAVASPEETVSPWIVQGEVELMLHIPEGIGYPITAAPLSQITID
jgi:8-oxo-dGTP pyrophosphatase MutT (NUDIX family)